MVRIPALFFLGGLCSVVAGAALAQVAADEPIRPIVAAKPKNPALVELGKKLYFDPRLSKTGFISCNSCHNLSMGGSDNLKTSIGHKWQAVPINTPTVLNSSLSIAQFWDGRAPTLQAQAVGVFANPGLAPFTHEFSIELLQSIPGYVAEFKTTFGSDKIDIDNATQALAAFEETLVTPNSRFDKWLKGDKSALSEEELAGYQLFKNSGCTACHNGPGVGGNSFQKFGVVENYKTINPALGRIAVTGKDEDRFYFKVPTLRNVELTYPYFHDGEAATLRDAVDTMGRIQLGRIFTEDENHKIVAFLKSLTGEQPLIKLPILPPSTEKTPPPRPFEN